MAWIDGLFPAVHQHTIWPSDSRRRMVYVYPKLNDNLRYAERAIVV